MAYHSSIFFPCALGNTQTEKQIEVVNKEMFFFCLGTGVQVEVRVCVCVCVLEVTDISRETTAR